MWFSHYKTLFTSVGYDCNTLESIISDSMLPSADELKLVSCTEVRDIIAAMTNNKAGDCYGLRAEHFKLAGDLYYSLLATSFNVMLVHGFIHTEATQTVICPTIKDKNGISSDASNYRPIALTTIFLSLIHI